ncbi:MAG: hypothetical protein ACK5SV_00755 [Burkholderiales bacterium]
MTIADLRHQALASAFEFGPYCITVRECPAHQMPVLRRHGCIDLGAERIFIREGLRPEAWRRAFLHALVRLVHYAQAVLLHESTEEHLTHSLASGLSQWVRRNPALGWALLRACSPHLRPKIIAPRRVLVGEQSWTVRSLPVKTAQRLRLFGQADLERRCIQLDPALRDTQLAVIFLHECLHALHHVHRVTDETPLGRAHSVQTDALAAFIHANPGAWSWWFGVLLHGSRQPQWDPAGGVQQRSGRYHTPGSALVPLAH